MGVDSLLHSVMQKSSEYQKMTDRLIYLCSKTIEWSLVFIIAAVPLIINPFAFDLWYRPKISSVQALLLIAGIAWFAKTLVTKRKLYWQWNALTASILSYAAAAFVSTIFSINPTLSLYGDPLRLEGLFTIASYILLVYLFKDNVKTPELASGLFFWLMLSATLVAVYALFQYFCYNPTEHFIYKYFPKGNGVGSTIGNPNFLGKYLVLIIPIIVAFCLAETVRLRMAGLFFSLLLCFAALMATLTRASWIGLLVSMTLLLLLAFKNSLMTGKTQKIVFITISLLLIVCLFNMYIPAHGKGPSASTGKQVRGEVVQKAVKTFDMRNGRGVATRLYVWEKTLRLIMEKPWFGYGLETFMLVFEKFNQQYTDIFHDRVIIDRAHNNYLDTAFSMGFTGLAAYVAILVSFIMFVWQLIGRIQDISIKLIFIGIISGFCGYLVNDLFIFSVVSVSPTFWSLMGLTLAAGGLARADAKTVFPIHQNPKTRISS